MKVLLTGAFQYDQEQLKQLSDLGLEFVFQQQEQDSANFIASEIDAVVCNNLFQFHDINRFSQLRFIQTTSAGLDRLPLTVIAQRNIQIRNAAGVYSIPIAEWIVGKILEIYKNSSLFYKQQTQQNWLKNRNLLELYSKTVLIVGFGNIGVELAKRLKAFEVNLIAVEGKKNSASELALLNRCYLPEQLDEALVQADIVVLTLPLNDSTFHLLNAERLNLLKPHALLVNTSRGAIIDQHALLDKLKQRSVMAALDVFEEEPLPPDSEIWSLPNVIATPHNSFVSDHINDRLFKLIYSNLNSFICTEANKA